VNVESVDRIIYSIFQRFNLEWKSRTLKLFTQAAWRHLRHDEAQVYPSGCCELGL